MLLLCKEFTGWVLLANLFAWPAAYLIMRYWLQSFAYRTAIHLQSFLLAALLSVLIALLTVSWQALKAARANPVHALKYE